MGHSKGIGLFLRGESFGIVTGVSLCIFFFEGGFWMCILRHLGGRGEGGREGEENKKREKFLTIVNISKKKYMPKNAYFMPSNICRRSVVLSPPFPPSPLPAPLPPIPFDDDPAKIFSQAISQQGYHFNNRKYLLPDDIYIISFSFSFLFFLQIQKKEKKFTPRAAKQRHLPPFPFPFPLQPTTGVDGGGDGGGDVFAYPKPILLLI